MELVLQQKQTLNLVMTTELRQAIALLQYTTYELYEYIKEQELENPLIELEERVHDPAYRRGTNRMNRSDDSYQNPIDFIANDDKGMREHLIEQTKWLNLNDQNREVVHYLILNLDENAYLPLKIEEITDQLAISEKEANEGIRLLQQLDPVGIGARSLQECLLLQVKRNYPEEEMVQRIIMDYLELLANKKWHEIAEKLSISLEAIKEAYDLIQTLDPKPCTSITDTNTQYLTPDIMIDQKDNQFTISLNDHYLPKINFNNEYSNLLKGNNEASHYIQEYYKNYQWLLNSIEQRRSTILKITNVILDKQQGFFQNGFSALKPLTMKEVADEIDMHESTVSRATTNKVIQTPKGSFEFRRLFTSKLQTKNGDSMSQTRVKLLLEDLVNNENKYKPFSDQKLSDYFKTEKGVTISRRTVAKYREELNIPSSRQRKEIKV